MLRSRHTQFNYDGNKYKLETMGKSIAFGWYRGKYSHLDGRSIEIVESDFADYLSNLEEYETRLANGEIKW
jgi:hypothetical protein